LEDFLSGLQAILNMEAYCILGVFQNLLISIALGVTALEFGTKGIVAFAILFNYYRKSVSRHSKTSLNISVLFYTNLNIKRRLIIKSFRKEKVKKPGGRMDTCMETKL